MKTKVLHIIPTLNPEGGGPMAGIFSMVPHTAAWGFETDVACFDEPGSDFAKGQAVKVHCLGAGWLGYSLSWTFYKWLVSNIGNYDIVVVNGIWQFHSLATWLASRKKNIPYLLYTHGMLDPWFNKAYPLKFLKKFIYWNIFERRVVRDAHSVLFTSEDECLLARTSFNNYKANERIVKYGATVEVSTEFSGASLIYERYPELSRCRIFLYLSRIHEKKGCDLLIRAFAEVLKDYPDVRLVIAGGGADDYISYLKGIASDAGVRDKVYWLGMVRDEMKVAAFKSANVFILPSHQENFGIAVAESLGYGVPVLISKKINIWREIVDDCAGFAEADTYSGTLLNMRRWLSISIEGQEAIRSNAIKCYSDRFTSKAMARSFYDVVTSVLRKTG